MKVIELAPEQIVVSDDLRRSGSAKQFEERLRSSIEEIGLAEPLKVALMPSGQYLVVDGAMRLRAITAIREADPTAFRKIPAYVTDYERRYEIRYQTDIYQDLLPSQLATLVEHLHKAERVRKVDIARYIGVSPTTLRNYTGLWRLMQRKGLFSRIVELMDVGTIPSSNPYVWLRLNDEGLRYVLEQRLTEGVRAEEWIKQKVLDARQGQAVRYQTGFVESITDGLDANFYREDEDLRSVKRDLGLRRAASHHQGTLTNPQAVSPNSQEAPPTRTPAPIHDVTAAMLHLKRVSREATNPVLKRAAESFRMYLQ
jgi:hypothetical protein